MADDAKDLANRLKHIAELTDELAKTQIDNANAHQLASRISEEVARLREGLKTIPRRTK